MMTQSEVEITEKSGMIEANTKIIVKRLPMKESEPIELEYRIDRNMLYKRGNE
jgi:hypothetical protein